MQAAYAPFQIALSPVSILIGVLQTTTFGWYIVINSLLPVFLQEPWEPAKGVHGYGFNPTQTGLCKFATPQSSAHQKKSLPHTSQSPSASGQESSQLNCTGTPSMTAF